MTAAPATSLPRPMRVARRRRETHDTFTLTLEAPGDAPVPSFAPGQFNMLYAFGVGEAPISISGDPTRARELVHTIRAVGPVTQALGALRAGDTVGVRGPFGTAWPVERAAGLDLVIVAGGIGLAPLRPVLYHALAHRTDYHRVLLLYGARTPRDLLYARELWRWRARFDVDVLVTVDRGDTDWRGPVGVVTGLAPRAAIAPLDSVACVCGPEVMIRFVARELTDRGIPADHVFVSLERNMQCATGVCGHCQLGPVLVCRDGAVFPYPRVEPLMKVREL
jgi:NAD(P)H-flavin reductase